MGTTSASVPGLTSPVERIPALVIGAGPAGLIAAEMLASAGLAVTVAEAKPSVARKLLMAGKSGLNLTKAEAPDDFLAAYGDAARWLRPALAAFGPQEVREWAESLGEPCFTGTSGRVFPRSMKASPLLRAWLARLATAGATIRTRWRWLGWQGTAARFATPDGERRIKAAATVLALGGASWARLGSDGAWARALADAGVALAPFAPANMGFDVSWSPPMTPHLGTPLKSVALIAGGRRLRGEVMITATGIEGGGLYPLSATLRDMGDGATLGIDLLPDLAEDEVARRLARPRGKASLSNHLRRTLRLPPVKLALMRHAVRDLPADPVLLARIAKQLPLRLGAARPLDEAISTAGGIRADAVDGKLMLRARPGVFAAGEMLDWEAPTGGYLLTACLATGRLAGLSAAAWAQGQEESRLLPAGEDGDPDQRPLDEGHPRHRP